MYVKELNEKLTMARSHLCTAQCRQERDYDTHSQLQERRFGACDLVHIWNMTTRVGQSDLDEYAKVRIERNSHMPLMYYSHCSSTSL